MDGFMEALNFSQNNFNEHETQFLYENPKTF